MDKEKINLLIEKIRGAQTILIFGHKNPDGDSVSAALGLRALIRDNFRIDADVAYDGNFPISLDFLPGRADVWYAEKIADRKYDLFIAVDMGSRSQFGDMGSRLFDAAADSVKIDHHRTENWNGNLNFVNPDKSSACEIIFDIARAAGWKINPDAATCLCVGIYTDTGKFAYIDAPNNKPLLDAAQLVDLGANMREISEGLNNFTLGDVMAEADVLSHAEFFYGNRLAVATIPNKLYKKLDAGTTQIVMFLRKIKGVECVAVLKEAHSDETGLSLRSRSIPIRPMAEKFGGGGHDLGAGAKMAMPIAEAKKVVVAEFKGIFSE
jgi:phosphoesterase RecJ-like protein